MHANALYLYANRPQSALGWVLGSLWEVPAVLCRRRMYIYGHLYIYGGWYFAKKCEIVLMKLVLIR